ncbi:MAG: DUF1295 domain-containing protein [Ectothiorhodospiraceae bacterium]|nr:DUF1295 domain-containing protein [Ectothiorhodospiraceae bacterium]
MSGSAAVMLLGLALAPSLMVLVWMGFFLIAAAGGGWWTVVSVALMIFLIVRVSGVTLLERSLKESRPGYADYVARTSALIPGPPRDKATL